MRRVPAVLAALALAALVAGAGYKLAHKTSETAEPAARQTAPAKIKSSPELAASYLVAGDVFWGRGVDFFAQQTPQKYDWPFSRLNEFNPQGYDGWLANMECPVSDIQVPISLQTNSLIFSCSPKYLPAASKYFTAFTLANNHMGNVGAQGLADTRSNLAKYGIQFFGDYDLGQTDNLCDVVALKAKVNGRDVQLPIAMCGYHWLSRMPTDTELAQISRYAQYFPVWVFPHGGTEYATHSNAQQDALYRKMIDLGADAVFGSHPHYVQETEAYHGKLIVYDFGDMIFDQWFDSEVTKSLIVNAKVSAAVDSNLQKYLDMASGCAKYKDSCLQTAKEEGLKKYALKYSYGIISGERSTDKLNDRVTHPGSQATQDWLLKRTNWVSVSAALNQ
ncbi:MAG TPA: CapA family protein [Candidatus Saccharimonadales bacterium]|nr:CapA family protein [Candidatus Saccharimonadales bacterium]